MAMTTCTERGKDISDKAETCPHCGYKHPTDIKAAVKADLKRKVGAKEIIGGIVVVGIAMALFSDGPDTATPTTATAQAAAAPKAPAATIKATANELFNAYESNEVATDDELRGNLVLVTGKVQAIDKDFMDNAVVQLATSNQFSPVRLTLKDSEKPQAAKLKRGEQTAITCPKMSRIIGSPAGSDCYF